MLLWNFIIKYYIVTFKRGEGEKYNCYIIYLTEKSIYKDSFKEI